MSLGRRAAVLESSSSSSGSTAVIKTRPQGNSGRKGFIWLHLHSPVHPVRCPGVAPPTSIIYQENAHTDCLQSDGDKSSIEITSSEKCLGLFQIYKNIPPTTIPGPQAVAQPLKLRE